MLPLTRLHTSPKIENRNVFLGVKGAEKRALVAYFTTVTYKKKRKKIATNSMMLHIHEYENMN